MNKWTRFKTDLWIWLNQIDNDSVVAIVLMEMLNQDTESDTLPIGMLFCPTWKCGTEYLTNPIKKVCTKQVQTIHM